MNAVVRLLVVAILLVAGVPAGADFQAGVAPYERGDFQAGVVVVHRVSPVRGAGAQVLDPVHGGAQTARLVGCELSRPGQFRHVWPPLRTNIVI